MLTRIEETYRCPSCGGMLKVDRPASQKTVTIFACEKCRKRIKVWDYP